MGDYSTFRKSTEFVSWTSRNKKIKNMACFVFPTSSSWLKNVYYNIIVCTRSQFIDLTGQDAGWVKILHLSPTGLADYQNLSYKARNSQALNCQLVIGLKMFACTIPGKIIFYNNNCKILWQKNPAYGRQ